MAILNTLKQELENKHVPFEVLTHRPVYTAQEVAAAQHVPGRDLAKVVIVSTGKRLLMVVLPAICRLDLLKLAAAVPDGHLRLATESEFEAIFPGCEAGAMPPFGNLFGIEVYVDNGLAHEERIVFQAGTHTETVRMRYSDFAHLVRPTTGDFALLRDDTDRP